MLAKKRQDVLSVEELEMHPAEKRRLLLGIRSNAHDDTELFTQTDGMGDGRKVRLQWQADQHLIDNVTLQERLQIADCATDRPVRVGALFLDGPLAHEAEDALAQFRAGIELGSQARGSLVEAHNQQLPARHPRATRVSQDLLNRDSAQAENGRHDHPEGQEVFR